MIPRKVIFLFTPGPVGGAEKIVLNGVKALRAENIDVSLWIIKEERVPEVADAFIQLLSEQNVQSRVFSSQSVFDPRLLRSLKESMKLEQATIIHAHGFKAAFYAHFAAPQSAKLIITHHGKTGHTFKVKIYEFIETQIMKRANAVIAVSQDMKKMLSTSGINTNKTTVVENFLTTEVITLKNSQVSPIQLLFVGRLSPEKGCSVLIDSLATLDSKKFHLTILGNGVEMKMLQAKVDSLQLKEMVSFVGFKNNVAEYMANSDALVMPSFREGQPLALIEACCMGLPIVASNVGGIPELVIENKNGYLFEAGNVSELSNKLNLLPQNLEVLKGTASEMKVKSFERFSSRTWAKNTIKVYDIALSQL
jgi:glycosyltransferase involved in cell wall biosynthesis